MISKDPHNDLFGLNFLLAGSYHKDGLDHMQLFELWRIDHLACAIKLDNK